MKFIVITLCLSILSPKASADCAVPLTSEPNDLGSSLPLATLFGYFQCDPADPANDLSPCNTFVGRAVKEMYNLDDFSTNTGYMLANEMAKNLSAGFKKWRKVGTVFNEYNSLCAQSLANKGYPVIAVLQDSGHGHAALILPGRVRQSGAWGGLSAPNSASFRLGDAAGSYVSKPLSYSFGRGNAIRATYYYSEVF